LVTPRKPVPATATVTPLLGVARVMLAVVAGTTVSTANVKGSGVRVGLYGAPVVGLPVALVTVEA
jgi:hypothetical protein